MILGYTQTSNRYHLISPDFLWVVLILFIIIHQCDLTTQILPLVSRTQQISHNFNHWNCPHSHSIPVHSRDFLCSLNRIILPYLRVKGNPYLKMFHFNHSRDSALLWLADRPDRRFENPKKRIKKIAGLSTRKVYMTFSGWVLFQRLSHFPPLDVLNWCLIFGLSVAVTTNQIAH